MLWLVTAIFTQKFVSFDNVSLKTDTIGLQLPEQADVKVRGVIVGQVNEIASNGEGADPDAGHPARQDRPDPRQRHRGDPAQDALR